MSVEFNEGPVLSTRAPKAKYSFPTMLVMKMGLAKTPEAAATVLIVIAVAAALIAVFIFMSLGSTPPPATPAQLETT